MPNKYIGYYNVIDSRNKIKVKEIEDSIIPVNYIKTVKYSEINTISKEKGSCIQIEYGNIMEKREIQKKLSKKYKVCEDFKEDRILRFKNRKCA